MSIKIMSLVWDRFPDGGPELLTMLALADWSDDNGRNLNPSITAVARKIRRHEKNARDTLKALCDNDFLRVVGNATGGAPGMTKQYEINVDRLLNLPSVHQKPTLQPIAASNLTGNEIVRGNDSVRGNDFVRGTGNETVRGTGNDSVRGNEIVRGNDSVRGQNSNSLFLNDAENQTGNENVRGNEIVTGNEIVSQHVNDVNVVNPLTTSADPAGSSAQPAVVARKEKAKALTTETWEAYDAAFQQKYGVPAVRTARISSQLKAIVEYVGKDEAPNFMRFYLQQGGYYEQQAHDVAYCVRDLQKLNVTYRGARAISGPQGLAEFYDLYPVQRRGDMEKVARLWLENGLDDPVKSAAVIEALAILKESEGWKKAEGKYVPGMVKFLLERRYEGVQRQQGYGFDPARVSHGKNVSNL